MGDFKFEGEVNSLSEVQLKFVSDVLKKRGFTNEKVIIEPVGKAGDNYVANVKKITVEKGEGTFKMIAKVAPNNPMLRQTMPFGVFFKNEHVIYTQVLPKFAELERSADIPKNERFKFAECYGTFMEDCGEIILLEDLSVSNYTILDKFQSFTDESAKMVLRNVAHFHCLSYALKHQEPEIYESFKTQLINMWPVMPEEMLMFFGQVELSIISCLDNEKYKKLIQGSITNLKGIVKKNINYVTNSKYSVIHQGDAWTNNILFKLEDGKPVECCLIDYQQANHNNPAADLLYMIFNCTDYETRSKHYHEWIDYYHNELDRRLSQFGLKANLIFPRDQLDADLRRFGKHYFAFALLLNGNIMRESSEAENMKAAMETASGMEELMSHIHIDTIQNTSLIRIKSRVEGLIESFLELGYINEVPVSDNSKY